MSLHVFANVVTPLGTAANNRGETEGNITTLQKLVWRGSVHSTVSAEAIRFAMRRALASMEEHGTNRTWDEEARTNDWKDPGFGRWMDPGDNGFIDDDLLGFMAAEAARHEGERGSVAVRRSVIEVTRAVSLTPWPGDVTFNAASPNATPSAQKRGAFPVPYGAEIHATRYQYGLAMTPERLRDRSRAAKALRAIGSLHTVAGNHGRFLYDFSPDAVILRITDDPAPRLLYCFETSDDGRTVEAPKLIERIRSRDVLADELIVGGLPTDIRTRQELEGLGVEAAFEGVRAAIECACHALVQLLEQGSAVLDVPQVRKAIRNAIEERGNRT